MTAAPPFTWPAPAAAAEPRPEALFRAAGLTKTYGSGEAAVHALRGVDLELFAGEMLVLLGPSGSGKSTLLNHLGGLDVPSSGSLEFRGLDLAGASEQELTAFRRNSIGFVFQFYNLIPSLTARENVALITELAPDPMEPAEALRLVELGDRIDHFPSQLSGGQQQRVAIARAIAKRPEVILCDEPTGALDARTGATVLAALERVNRELGTLTLIVTHNACLAGLADRVLHFSDGRLVRVERNPRRRAVEELVW